MAIWVTDVHAFLKTCTWKRYDVSDLSETFRLLWLDPSGFVSGKMPEKC